MSRKCVALLFAVLCCISAPAAHQAAAAFDVASVKPFTDKVLIYSGVSTQPGGRVSAKATTLQELVAYAYAVELREVETTGDWMTAERFDIEGRGSV
jgi:uncharacterized protein (TIGR03435 family)